MHEVIQSRFIDGNDAVIQIVDLLFIGVDAMDRCAEFGEACAADKADIAGADDGKCS